MLARCLLDRAQQELDRVKRSQQKPTEPLPVVLNVSNWLAKEGTFDQWLLNEVVRRHSKDVDRDALRQPLVDGDLLLLPDGVDEHAEPGECARVINAIWTTTRHCPSSWPSCSSRTCKALTCARRACRTLT
jgi:hypothetical protein